MERKKISFDVDGVIAEGGYVEVADRSNTTYAKKRPVSDEVIPTLQWLSMFYDIYIISTRGHPSANLGLRAWLHFILGVELDTIAGVITHPFGDAQVAKKPNAPMDKGKIVRDLGILLHVDDSPTTVQSCKDRGILFPSDMPSSQAAKGKLPTLETWEGIRNFFTTPGMKLYGSDGMTVVSPAVEFGKTYPEVDPTKALPVQ